MRSDRADSVVPPSILIKPLESGKAAAVYDSVIKHCKLDDVGGELSGNDANTMVVRWELKNLRFSKSVSGTLRSKLNWNRRDGRATLRSRIPGADVDYVGTGTCKVIQK